MSNKEDINQLLARYFTGETLSLVQQQELDAWIASHQQEFEQMRRLMNAPMEASAEIHLMRVRPGKNRAAPGKPETDNGI